MTKLSFQHYSCQCHVILEISLICCSRIIYYYYNECTVVLLNVFVEILKYFFLIF